MADNRTRLIDEPMASDIVGPYPFTDLVAMDQAFVRAVAAAIRSGDERAESVTATVRIGRLIHS